MPPLSPERWRTLSPYLDEALEITSDERDDWLADISARDASLAADLQTLLAEHRALHDSGFLERAVLAPGTALPSLTGQVLGAYRLVSLLGQGGMGSVWLAERCDGRFEGRAAVKLLNISLMGRAGEERFKREGTILARLTHPQIGRLIDAGVSPAGQPYLVLEHVNGQSIDRYCDDRGLDVEARVRLFLDVLDAVAHAHANLIVHRDIKPANVLVSGEGQVKLLDFGIAKLLEPEGGWQGQKPAEISALSRDAGPALTPQYAAPEQLMGGMVTTATDVYALGVLLYVLLSGRHPAGRAAGSPATLIQAILHDEPERLSRAAVITEGLGEAQASRGVTPQRVGRAVREDLDDIVAKALKKDPSERYASVTAFADDLRRFLRNEPTSAHPNTLRYRALTFARRHARALVTSGAVVVLVSGLTGLYTIRLASERDRAQRESEKAVKISELLMGLLTSADPFAVGPRSEVTPRGLLDAAAEQVQRELTTEPELQTDILTMIGRTYRRLSVYDRAQVVLEQALASGQKAFGTEHVRIAQTLNDLGVLLAEKGEYAEAGRRLEQALTMRRKLLGPENADVAITLVELGRVYQDQGLNRRAEPLQREALRIRQTVLGEGHRETAVSQSDLASVLRLSGDLSGAEALLQQSLATNRRTRGEQHPNTATSLHDLALIEEGRGNFHSAEPQFRRVLDMQRKALGPRHPLVATTLHSLSRALMELRRHDDAARALQEALDIARPALGAGHQLIAIYTINAAAVELARERPAAAEAFVREGLRIRALAPDIVPSRRRTLPEDDWSLGATKTLLGAVLTSLGRYEEAETVLVEARRDLGAMPTPRPRDVRTNTLRLIELYEVWRKPQRAAAYRALLGT